MQLTTTVPAHQPFPVRLEVSTDGSQGGADASGRLVFSKLPSGARVESCHDYGDAPVAVVASLRDVEATPDRVILRWAWSGDAAASVERRQAGGLWTHHGSAVAEGAAVLRFEDPDVVPGSRYGYRLRWTAGERTAYGPEHWVTIPRPAELALEPPHPNPSSGRWRVSFVLPSKGDARLTVHDITGRTLQSRVLEGLEAGRHTVDLMVPRAATGLYFLKLSDGRASVVRRLLLTR